MIRTQAFQSRSRLLPSSWLQACCLALALFAAPAAHGQADIFASGFEPAVGNVPESDGEAARFLTQATFGPTWADIQSLRSSGYNAWFNQQFNAPPSHLVDYLDYVDGLDEPIYQNARLEGWWLNAVTAPDQLRQRVAYALSQILVVSDASGALGNEVYGISHFYDILVDGAFGNYRDLLGNITRSPAMGAYLSMLGNEAPDVDLNVRPDENFAREILQLFSIGLVELHPDGTPVLVGGDPVPSYDQYNIKAFAHVFTGWNFGNCDGFTFCYPGYPEAIGWNMPMRAFDDYHHVEADADPDNDELLLGVLRPNGGTPEANLEHALDNIFGHPNVGPFIARRLIQNLVTSNPSPDYIERVSAVFDDNGNGERGDLRAVVRAILLDLEARQGHLPNPSTFGKVREPLLRQTHLYRAFNAAAANGRYRDWNPESSYGQAPNRSASVFNFYLPDYQPPGEIADAGLYAPELQIITETLVTRTANRFWNFAERQHIDSPFAQNPDENRVLLDFRPIQPLAESIDPLLDRLDVLLMNGQMSAQMRNVLRDYLADIPYTDNNDSGGRRRTWEAVHLIMTSPEYIVQK